ncbi:MAG: hypothetical protein RJA44_555, partial [Pseudomonadota bacterium]
MSKSKAGREAAAMVAQKTERASTA